MKKRYIYDFKDYTEANGEIPLHEDGTPRVHTWLFNVPGETCACNGRAHFERNGASPIPVPMVKPHVLGAPRQYSDAKRDAVARQLMPPPPGATHSVDRRVNAFEIVEADLEDGSDRSKQIKAHLERGACHEVQPAEEAA